MTESWHQESDGKWYQNSYSNTGTDTEQTPQPKSADHVAPTFLYSYETVSPGRST